MKLLIEPFPLMVALPGKKTNNCQLMKSYLKILALSAFVASASFVEAQDVTKFNKKELLVAYQALLISKDSLIQVLNNEQNARLSLKNEYQQKVEAFSKTIREQDLKILEMTKKASDDSNSLQQLNKGLTEAQAEIASLKSKLEVVELSSKKTNRLADLNVLLGERIDSLLQIISKPTPVVEDLKNSPPSFAVTNIDLSEYEGTYIIPSVSKGSENYPPEFEEGEITFKVSNGKLIGTAEQTILPMRGLMKTRIEIIKINGNGVGSFKSSWENFDRWGKANQSGDGLGGSIRFVNNRVEFKGYLCKKINK